MRAWSNWQTLKGLALLRWAELKSLMQFRCFPLSLPAAASSNCVPHFAAPPSLCCLNLCCSEQVHTRGLPRAGTRHLPQHKLMLCVVCRSPHCRLHCDRQCLCVSACRPTKVEHCFWCVYQHASIHNTTWRLGTSMCGRARRHTSWNNIWLQAIDWLTMQKASTTATLL